MVFLDQKSLDPRDLPKYDRFLSHLQGNILKGHGREHAAYVFVRFEADKQEKVAKYLRKLAKDKLTSCKTQLHAIDMYKRHGVSSEAFYGLYFSATGYSYFGYDLSKFDDKAFVKGMVKAKLNDPPVADWEMGLQPQIDACFLVADSNKRNLNIAVDQLIAVLNGQLSYDQNKQNREKDRLANILSVEYGNVLRNDNGRAIEHFGYADGISQPLFLKDDVEAYYKANLAPLQFDPAAELALALIKDPFLPANEVAFGSYMVFRKLEQNVRGFKIAEQALSNELKLSKEDKERTGAMLIGRFEDGTPLILSDKEAGIIGSKTTNNFNYEGDPKGLRCPIHAHIRKTNPRTDPQKLIVRRGIPYGHQYVSPKLAAHSFEQLPQQDVGLLFVCFQSSITEQFELIQRHWANNPNFPQTDTGIDPLIGQDGKENISTGNFPKEYNKANFQKCSFANFVTMKGGEYFFAPSLAFLKKLKPQM